MTKKVKITILGTQNQCDGQTDSSRSTAEGMYYFRGGKHYIVFEELSPDHTDSIRSAMRFDEKRLVLIRQGGLNTRMEFERGVRMRSSYAAGPGTMVIDIDTKQYVLRESDGMMILKVSYKLFLEEKFCADCRIEVNINAVPEGR